MDIPTSVLATFEAHPRVELERLEWESLPNEFRNRPRLLPWRHPQPPIAQALPAPQMTSTDWEAWGL